MLWSYTCREQSMNCIIYNYRQGFSTHIYHTLPNKIPIHIIHVHVHLNMTIINRSSMWGPNEDRMCPWVTDALLKLENVSMSHRMSLLLLINIWASKVGRNDQILSEPRCTTYDLFLDKISLHGLPCIVAEFVAKCPVTNIPCIIRTRT